MNLFIALRERNTLLYWAGWLNFAGALVSAVMIAATDAEVMGINAWIKPMKFFVSIGIFCWTMGWYLHLLNNKRAAKRYSIMVVIVLAIEMIIITWQAANGRMSHFNVRDKFYLLLFNIMGVAIATLGIWTAFLAARFCRQQQFAAPMPYVWGIRLGLILFVIFSFEGGMMAARLSHTVGAPDGGAGLPLVNWSRVHGDLRIAHFVGMHALQIIPLFGFYVARTNRQVILFAIFYGAVVTALLIQALQGVPLF